MKIPTGLEVQRIVLALEGARYGIPQALEILGLAFDVVTVAEMIEEFIFYCGGCERWTRRDLTNKGSNVCCDCFRERRINRVIDWRIARYEAGTTANEANRA